MTDVSAFVHAIRGPIMLITLGGLVLIDYAGIYGFWRTWPVLIIVFGVLKLAERAGARPAQYNNRYPGGYTSGGYPSGNPGDRPPGGNVI
jgi:hypothetical protein